MTSIPLRLWSAALVALSASAAAQQNDDVLARWAATALIPTEATESAVRTTELAQIGEMIGDARIVSLSEAVHGAAEPLAFRNRLFRHLVEEKGFAVIALETGMTESRALHDYVLGDSDDIETTLARGFSWGFDVYPQNRELLEWLRAYNSNPANTTKVRIFGFDISGSPGNAAAARSVDTPLLEALNYLGVVDPTAATEMRNRLGPMLPMLRFDPSRAARPSAARQYVELMLSERDLLTAGIADVISLMERQQTSYIARSSPADYEWALRAAVGARQVDAFLRRLPVGWSEFLRAFAEMAEPIYETINVRARAMADNLDWIIGQAGETAGVLIFAHRGHMAGAPSRDSSGRELVPAGAYLRQRHGDRLVSIANLVADGRYGGCRNTGARRIRSPSPTSMDAVLARLERSPFVLDLRAAPPNVAATLDTIELIEEAFPTLSSALSQAFDIVYFSNPITPACLQ